MIYDPENPLSDEELDKIAEKDFELFLQYLDSKAEYLKQFTRPLNAVEVKKFASHQAASRGKKLTSEEWETVKKIGKENEQNILKKES